MEDYVQVEKQSEYCYVITAKGLKNNKKTSASVSFICVENKKKASVSLSLLNPVTSMSVKDGSSAVDEITITADPSAKVEKTLNLALTTADSQLTTDKVKVALSSKATGYSVSDKGAFKLTSKANSKLSAKLKDGVITITAQKGVSNGTTAYLIIYANNIEDGGISVIPVNISSGQ